MLVRGVEAEVLPVCQQYGMGVIAWSPLAGGWLRGRWRKGQEPPASARAERIPERYDLALPQNQRKLEAADALAVLAEEAGVSLIHLALAFVINHPAITAAIIGPRTMEQLESQLGSVDVTLDDSLLDQIDAIVPPGSNFSLADAGWTPPALADAHLRRR
jgi:aryl-alcohol dehydrogenase-like predicted oxidoreductase